MKIKHRNLGFELKALNEKGEFEGYGSVFNNTDAVRDVVVPGAFAKTLSAWKQKEAYPPILWQHNTDQPLGPFTDMAEDGKGLYVAGQLLVKEVRQAAEAHALLKAKAIRGLSIGYDVTDEEYDGDTNVNRLLAIDLWEVSIATFPANTQASVTAVKSMIASGELPSLKQFEEILRDAGFSRSVSTAIASHGYREVLEQREAGTKQVDLDVDSILALLREPLKL